MSEALSDENIKVNSMVSQHSPVTSTPSEDIELETDAVDHEHYQRNSTDFRRIQVNQKLQELKFKKNSISTSKYNLFTFIPKFLFEQFQKYSNIFFFFIVLMQVSLFFYFVL